MLISQRLVQKSKTAVSINSVVLEAQNKFYRRCDLIANVARMVLYWAVVSLNCILGRSRCSGAVLVMAVAKVKTVFIIFEISLFRLIIIVIRVCFVRRKFFIERVQALIDIIPEVGMLQRLICFYSPQLVKLE